MCLLYSVVLLFPQAYSSCVELCVDSKFLCINFELYLKKLSGVPIFIIHKLGWLSVFFFFFWERGWLSLFILKETKTRHVHQAIEFAQIIQSDPSYIDPQWYNFDFQVNWWIQLLKQQIRLSDGLSFFKIAMTIYIYRHTHIMNVIFPT